MNHPRMRRITALLQTICGKAVVALGACLALLVSSLAQAAPAPQAAGQYAAYLPFMQIGRPSAPPTTPAPVQGQGALFLNKQIKNNSADVAVDSAGGMHAAYAHFISNAENPKAIYTFCTAGASACANPAAWQSVALGNQVGEVQLALTGAGQPRLLIVSEASNLGRDHAYAACDQNCADLAAWTITSIVTTYNANDILDQDAPQRSFALDPQGRPAFIYTDRNYQYAEPDHYGAYYASCSENCADAGNWQTETNLSIIYRGGFRFDYEIFRYVSLTFTADGQPRLVARVFALNPDGSDAPDGVYYYGCDAACDMAESWARTFLIPTGDGSVPYPSWDLAIADGDRPRIALFTGTGLTPDDVNNRLLYLYCDTNCFDPANWGFGRVLGAPNDGNGADLELDAAGRPRLAWIASNGDLGYAWCNSGCETDQAAWQQQIVETEQALRQEHPQAIPPHCQTDLWNGLAPVLALDAAGNPHIAYDVSVKADCYYDDTPGDPSDAPTVRFESIWRGVHLAFFPHP
jgi:hypothetical protein